MSGTVWNVDSAVPVPQRGAGVVGERADDPEIAGIVCVVRLHGAQAALVKGRHQKAFGQVVEVVKRDCGQIYAMNCAVSCTKN